MIRKLLLILLFIVVKSNAQTYMGYLPDNYAGVQGVLFNPASIADSRFKTDVNLFSTSSSLNNDYFGVSLFDLPSDSYDVDKEGVRTPTKNNGAIVYSDIMGPSFMFNIAPKHSVALYTRARAILNGNNINGELFDELEGGFEEAENFNIAVGSPKIVGHTWAEFGATYAAVLLQKEQHFLKGGLTAKYLIGGINSYVDGNDITAFYIQTGDPETSQLITTGDLTIGSSQDFITGDEDVKFDANSKGFGADLGLVYEWRPDYKSQNVGNNFRDVNKYKLRVGLSVTDIGYIKYDNMKIDTYSINGIVSEQELEDADFDDLEAFLEEHYGAPVTKYISSKSNLPTMVHFDVDWNMYKKFYLNMSGNLSMVDDMGINKTYSQNSWMLTPRYETKWFTFSLPINYMEYTGTQVGTGLRFGPMFVGSSSLITNILSKESRGADVYFGLKIPVYQKKAKVKDDEEIID
ncbi:DUF5723 family protein [Flavobacterium adhaerens]|uniref:DUF5723 family protein n=1 Tax=Flavobacterium adhaerens TaxID=3149043 RepID=UPI0032B3465F